MATHHVLTHVSQLANVIKPATSMKDQAAVHEKVIQYKRSHAQVGQKKISEILGVSLRQVRKALHMKTPGQTPAANFMTTTPTTLPRAVDAEMFRRRFDVKMKVQEGLKLLSSQVISDNDFRLDLKIPVDRWRAVADLEEFQKNRLAIKDKIYWGQKAILEKIKQTMDVL